MQRTVDAFTDEAYKITRSRGGVAGSGWLGPWMVTGPVVRLKMDPDDARAFFQRGEVRHFTHGDGLAEGWYHAIESGSNYDSWGSPYGYVVVTPAAPPDPYRKGEYPFRLH